MATAPMPPLSFPSTSTASKYNPSNGGGTSIEDWLDLDQAGEACGLDGSDGFKFNDKFSGYDFTNNSAALDNDFSFNSAFTSEPSLSDTSFSLDPSTIMSYPLLGVDNSELASPLTFSPSSVESSSQPLNPGSEQHISDAGSFAGDIQVSPAASVTVPSAVDPQLTAPPNLSAATRISKHTVDPILEEEDDGSDEDMDDMRRSVSAAPGGSDGGSQKNSARKTQQSHPHALVDVPDWADKPSAEEYKKLSSKEKRQLRNKISARNFRHRRKEHISTLEQQVSQRDELIDSLRTDLGQVRTENKDLRAEVETLKSKWDDLMKRIEQMSLGASANNTSNAVASSSTGSVPPSPKARAAAVKSSSAIPKPNLYKDIGSHSMRAFHGTSGMAGGNVGVHTTLIPEIPVDPYTRPARNMNPALNNITTAQRQQFNKGLFTQHLRGTLGVTDIPAEDDFMDSNPVHMSPQALLEMRRQMYGKMAHNAPAFLAAGTSAESKIPEGFKPVFFNNPATAPTAPTTPTTTHTVKKPLPSPHLLPSELMGGKEPRDSSSASLSAFIEREAQLEAAEEHRRTLYVAGLAASTLLSRMTGIFLEAFKSGASGMTDTGKVAAVLEGRSELKVVEKAPPPYDASASTSAAAVASSSSNSTIDAAIESLGMQLRDVNLAPRSTSVGAAGMVAGVGVGMGGSYDGKVCNGRLGAL